MLLPRPVVAFLLVAIGIGTATFAADTVETPAAPALPRYQFRVGEVLKFRDELRDIELPGHKEQDAKIDFESNWQVWVVDRNQDGSYRLIMLRNVRLLRTDKPKPVTKGLADQVLEYLSTDKNAPKPPQPVEVFKNQILGYCDLHPDGRIVANETLGDAMYQLFQIDPYLLWMPLPATEAEFRSGWTAPGTVGKRSFKGLRTGIPTAKTQVMEFTEHDSLDVVTKMKSTRTGTFDTEQGRFRELRQDVQAEYSGGSARHRRTITLDSVETKPKLWMTQLHREALELFKFKAEYEKRSKAFDHSPTVKEFKAQVADAREKIQIARKSAALELIQEQYAALLKACDTSAETGAKYAAAREELFAKSPIDWELKDFEGRTHRRQDYHGKVIVLDYWYRYCTWCVKAMPQLEQLHEKYQGKDVVVLGMNLDQDEEDARFVIAKLGIKYPNLKISFGKTIYGMTGGRIRAYPTLLILDRSGRVRDIHEGYAPDLGIKVSETIDRLLQEPITKSK